MAPPVEFINLVKEYSQGWCGSGRLQALAGVTFQIEPGEVFGLVGPNRAGKTTLVKLLLSLCQPTSGAVRRLGLPAADRSTLGRVGYVHENQAFPRYLTARELLEYYGALGFLPETLVQERAARLLDLVGLSDRTAEPIARFSKGMVQRLGLAQALLNEPDLLVLDEPAEGLDVLGLDLVRDVIADWKDHGRTVLLVTHQLHEAVRVCDRAAVLRRGRLVFVGPMADLPGDDQQGPEDRLKALVRGPLEEVAAAARPAAETLWKHAAAPEEVLA